MQVVGPHSASLQASPWRKAAAGCWRGQVPSPSQPSAGPSVGWEEGKAQEPGCRQMQCVHVDTAACTGHSARQHRRRLCRGFLPHQPPPHVSLRDKETCHLLLSVEPPRAQEVLGSRHASGVPGSGTVCRLRVAFVVCARGGGSMASCGITITRKARGGGVKLHEAQGLVPRSEHPWPAGGCMCLAVRGQASETVPLTHTHTHTGPHR